MAGAAYPQSPRECTAEYIESLEDDLLGYEQSKRYASNKLRPFCTALTATETWTAKVFGPFGGDWVFEKAQKILGVSIEPRVASSMCRWVRKTTETMAGVLLNPDDEAKKLKEELARCKQK